MPETATSPDSTTGADPIEWAAQLLTDVTELQYRHVPATDTAPAAHLFRGRRDGVTVRFVQQGQQLVEICNTDRKRITGGRTVESVLQRRQFVERRKQEGTWVGRPFDPQQKRLQRLVASTVVRRRTA